MSDQRTNQTVAERLELQLERFPNPLHRHRRWFTLAGGLVPLLFVGLFMARRDHTIFLSRPVAESHQYFQADCQKCHDTPWQPLMRLASADPAAKSVHDQVCHQCHDQRNDDHNAWAKDVPRCADCHLEHRGAVRLTNQADASCVKCHAPFEDHPEFALLRSWPQNQKLSDSAKATKKQLMAIAKLEPIAGTWKDKTKLKFSHQQHLAPLQTRWNPDADESTSAQLTQLQCADCHKLDVHGETMRPIVFEKHCQDCHPLRFSNKLDVASAPNDRGHSLPHETPEFVRGAMRQRLVDYARRHPGTVLPISRLPNLTSPRTPTPKQEWDWVERQLAALEDAIFRTSATDVAAHRSNACLKCHAAVPVSSDAAPGFAIVPPGIPTRWMPRGQFRHDRHLNMECIQCHQAQGAKTVQDILLPTQNICQSCHGATRGSLPQVRRARKHCTECHQYHHHVHLDKASQ